MKILAYLRTSTAEQETGIDIQKDTIIKYINYKGLHIDEDDFYEDEAVSGVKNSRPGLDALRERISNDPDVSMIIVYSLSRLGRSASDILINLKLFKEHNIEFVSTKESLDTSTPMGKAMVGMTAVFAELDRDTIVQRLHEGRIHAAKNGTRFGAKQQYNRKEIQKYRRDGLTMQQIANKTGASKSTIHRILKSKGE